MQKNVRKLEGEGRYMVLSASEPGLWHLVLTNEPFCDCKGFQHRGGCRHLQMLKNLEKGPMDLPQRLPEMFTARYRMKELGQVDVVKVRITLGAPKFQLAYSLDAHVSDLAPTYAMFKIKEWDSYAAVYRRHLEVIGINTIATRLAELADKFDDKPLALLCFEDLTKPGEKCHRRLFADWWEEHTGKHVPEMFVPHDLFRYCGAAGALYANGPTDQEGLF